MGGTDLMSVHCIGSAYLPCTIAPFAVDGGPGYVQTIRQLMPKMVAGSSSQYDRIRQTKSFRWHDGSATVFFQ